MSEFEYSDDNFSKKSAPIFKKPKPKTIKRIKKELGLFYSNLFNDSFNLIDSFVKSKKFTYDSFLEYFHTTKFHEIYCTTTNIEQKVKQSFVSPHHYISTAQDAFAVASKFLRSASREARIGAVYLLYTLHDTQPLKTRYQIKIKMEPQDYNRTKKLVDEYLNKGLVHPAYYFYDLNNRNQIKICAKVVNPCLEANFPSLVIRKHLGRIADHYFKMEIEESKVFDPISKLKIIEDQMRSELTYINKLSEMSIGHKLYSNNKPELSQTLMKIKKNLVFNNIESQDQSDKNSSFKQSQFKHRKITAFPGKNENILDVKVEFTAQKNINEPKYKRNRKSTMSFYEIKAWERMIKTENDFSEISTEQNEPTKSMLLSDMIKTDLIDYGTMMRTTPM